MVEATQRKAQPISTSPDTAARSGGAKVSRGADADREFDGLLSLLRVAPWTYDPHKNTITWQRIFAETPGQVRPQSTERLADVVSRYREDDRANLLRHYESALRDGHHGPVRFTVFNRAGMPTHIESAAIRAESEAGAPIVRGVFRNCEEDVGREVQLQDALSLLSRLTAISPSAIMLLDGEGLIRSANPEFLRLFKITDERLLIARHIRASANLLGKAFVATTTMLLENDKDVVKSQQKFQLPDNSTLTMNYRAQRFGIDDSGRGLLLAGEVTNPDALDMGAVFDRLPTPMMAISLPEHTIAAANSAALRAFGLRREHVSRETVTQILMRPDDLQQIQRDIEAEGGDAGLVCSVRSLHGGGLNYRVRAGHFSENGRAFLVLEFHETTATPREKTVPKSQGPKRGLLSRVVDHLDF